MIELVKSNENLLKKQQNNVPNSYTVRGMIYDLMRKVYNIILPSLNCQYPLKMEIESLFDIYKRPTFKIESSENIDYFIIYNSDISYIKSTIDILNLFKNKRLSEEEKIDIVINDILLYSDSNNINNINH